MSDGDHGIAGASEGLRRRSTSAARSCSDRSGAARVRPALPRSHSRTLTGELARAGPLRTIDGAAFPNGLRESELFGRLGAPGAAALLEIPASTLQSRLKSLGLSRRPTLPEEK